MIIKPNSRLFYSKGLSYSALAVSDNGTFVGTGTMSEVTFDPDFLLDDDILEVCKIPNN